MGAACVRLMSSPRARSRSLPVGPACSLLAIVFVAQPKLAAGAKCGAREHKWAPIDGAARLCVGGALGQLFRRGRALAVVMVVRRAAVFLAGRPAGRTFYG